MGTILSTAALVAAIPVALALILDLVFGQSRFKGVIAALVSFSLSWSLIAVYYLIWTPPLVGPWWGWAWELVFIGTITTVIFAIITRDGYRYLTPGGWARLVRSTPGNAVNWVHDVPGAAVVGLLTVLVLLSNIAMAVFTPLGNAEAKEMASHIVVTEAELGSVPETTPEKLPIMSMEAAKDKAEQSFGSYAIPEGFPEAGANLSTRFSVADEGNLIYYEDQLWWVYELYFKGSHSNAVFERTSPGYVLVDAHDNREKPRVELGYKIKYATVHYGFNEVQRYIWSKGYQHYLLDDIRLELDDEGNPFFVGALSVRAERFSGSLPVKAFWMDAQTGEITVSDLKDAPAWAERILSADTVRFIVDAWGNWGQADWTPLPWKKNRGTRFEVVGNPEMVYTESGGIQWQVLMRAKRATGSSLTHFLILDEHELKGTLYPAQNVADEKRVKEVVKEATNDNREPQDAYLMRLYTRLTWVVPLDTKSGSDDEERSSFSGLALVPADTVDASNVVVGKDRDRALFDYRRWLDRAIIQLPESAAKKTVTGTVEAVTNLVMRGESVMLLQLEGEPDFRYRLLVDTQGMPIEAVEIQPGDVVTINYIDVERQIRGVEKIDVEGVDLSEPVGS